MKNYKIGAKVQWKWLGRAINGVVKEIFFESVTKTIKGKAIKRNGSTEKPAYLVESDAGNLALKLQSELTPQPNTKSRPRKSPSMFSD